MKRGIQRQNGEEQKYQKLTKKNIYIEYKESEKEQNKVMIGKRSDR